METTQQRSSRGHEQHRVLAIRGRSYCNSACVFCIEKFIEQPIVAPKVDDTREAIVEGAGKYNMLFFMNGEPTLNRKLFEYVELGKANGYLYFGMSSHFRTLKDPAFAQRILDAGFEFFDISLHAANYKTQEETNPIGDGGASLKEALHGLRNLYELARRSERRVAVSHKIVITRLNYRELLPIFNATFKLGVRNFILQPVKVSGLDADLAASLAINEDAFMPYVNDFLEKTEDSGAEIKLYGMSQLTARKSKHLAQETNVVRHVMEKEPKRSLSLYQGDRLVSAAPAQPGVRTGVAHRVTLRLPTMTQTATFECAEDQFILNAALRADLGLPFGCRMGSCGQCCGRILQGKVEHGEQYVLTDELIDMGYALLCKSQPRSDVVMVTHQEGELGL
ncbi:MAG: 2Fe-2S iron-sulfur cluster-binding protein [Polyangiaceae bacterium]